CPVTPEVASSSLVGPACEIKGLRNLRNPFVVSIDGLRTVFMIRMPQIMKNKARHLRPLSCEMPPSQSLLYSPTTPLSLALCFSALTMGKIRLVIAPLEPGHKGEALLNRIRLEGQHNLE